MRLVPRLWLLKRKRRTRIFQQMGVREIVSAVLGEAGIATRWQLGREHPVREYCTQYEESDHRFVARLLAESGIYFFFPQGPLDDGEPAGPDAMVPGDSVVFGDDPAGYPPIGGDGSAGGEAPSLSFMAMQQTTASHKDKVTHFAPRTTVRAEASVFRDYDPERPMARLISSATSTHPFPAPEASLIDTAVAAFTGKSGAALGLEVYDHHGPFLFPKWSFASDQAPLILRQKRRRASTARGEGGCAELAPGHRFTLENHPGAHVNRTYVVTSVEHRGEARSQGGEWRVYRNTFECAPVEVTYVPPRPKRRSVQVALTATVTGPAGEEIHVDALGQIKVQFHWDRDGGYDERSSCWIRPMQAWGGAGWGSQFIPRVGMEVVVVFEGGDTDKPMILGSLYNGTHPPPFLLPADKTRSGWRTQSSPGGGGNNELSFEDAATREQIYVHAQRDLDEVVERNHTLQVRGDESVRVVGSRVDIVEGDVIARVAGNEEAQVTGDQSTQVEGNRVDVVTGNSDERVSGERTTRLGRERHEVTGRADLTYGDDSTLRMKGCHTMLVGRHDAKRSYVVRVEGTSQLSTSGVMEIDSEKGLTLKCGKSYIKISADKIEVVADAVSVKGEGGGLSVADDQLKLGAKGQVLIDTEKVLIQTPDTSLSMKTDVQIDGKKILLNSPDRVTDPVKDESPPPTKLKMKDKSGKPLAYQRFLITMADGSEYSGILDGDGEAEMDLEGSGTVTFPDLGESSGG
jgi:type VI secretion system VgrG family protein